MTDITREYLNLAEEVEIMRRILHGSSDPVPAVEGILYHRYKGNDVHAESLLEEARRNVARSRFNPDD